MVAKIVALRVLIIEKNKHLYKILKSCLESPSVHIIHGTSLEQISLSIYKKSFLLILDTDLEVAKNVSLIKNIRDHNVLLQIIMLGPNNHELAIKAYKLGINHYHTKPINCELLKAQIAQFTSLYYKSVVLELEDIRIEIASQSFYIHNKRILFTYQEFRLLLLLVTNEGRILSRNVINRHLSNGINDLSYAAIDTLVCRIRSKLNKYLEKSFIKTEYKVGYRINPMYLEAHHVEKNIS